MDTTLRLTQIFQRLSHHYGPLHWWPAETPFEVAVGAILTQNTTWTQVERAIDNLRQADVLSPAALRRVATTDLELMVRPAGFFRQKAHRLKLLAEHLCTFHDGRLEVLLAGPTEPVRRELLSLKGVGPETADSILLYAGGHPVFVVDAYTHRLCSRLGLTAGRMDYQALQALFMDHLPADAAQFNAYHGLIVQVCKDVCRKRSPRCPACPLAIDCPSAGSF
ncbi:endonuclease III domain-containing protein [Desulfuromonas sp. AOP6]|uniref:endonuclease III domain-containing protein n=1 Tax=Desulfuromonas sp. AOP6 TaxID=1566351 RepID=UPI001285C339|nr:endonuclease III domain-containing protein [Desulfuromonas sp. AOP6]BCA78420.1 endonuclease III [Desulfuromonas sp. AOP6]